MNIEEKKKKIITYLVEKLSLLEPEGTNAERYRALLEPMTNEEFGAFMEHLKNKEEQIHIYMPNLKSLLKQENISNAAKSVGVALFEKLWLVDKSTGRKYLTPNEYLVVQLPVRRLSQFLLHKLAVPRSDKSIDYLTGQVTGDDQVSALSQVEIQSLFARGLTSTLTEFVKVRGGDINAYSNFKNQMEETGQASLQALESNTTARSVVITSVILKGMMLDNNLYEG